jgi:lysophospholipase L1-like esterase
MPAWMLPAVFTTWWITIGASVLWADEFALHDGDKVGFLGDSITAEGTYGKLIENFVLLRYPDREVSFLNLGAGGDTAAGGLKRLEHDVFGRGITVLFVAYGINDIGWGGKADEVHRSRYLDATRDIVRECHRRGVRVFICSAAVTREDPDKSEQGFLQNMCDEGLAIARAEGAATIDVQRTMRSIQRTLARYNERASEDKEESLHAADGIHLNALGQAAFAYAVLKDLGAVQVVSSCQIDAEGAAPPMADRCEISNVQMSPQGGSFDRLDDALPFNNGAFAAFTYRFVPFPDINRYLLEVDDLEAGNYELRVDGRGVGVFSSQRLAEGVDIASATMDGWRPGGPWDAQATTLKELTECRSRLALANRNATYFLESEPWVRQLRAQSSKTNTDIESLQRHVARPRTYRFVLTRQMDNESTPTL